jgi:hypothetical protein
MFASPQVNQQQMGMRALPCDRSNMSLPRMPCGSELPFGAAAAFSLNSANAPQLDLYQPRSVSTPFPYDPKATGCRSPGGFMGAYPIPDDVAQWQSCPAFTGPFGYYALNDKTPCQYGYDPFSEDFDNIRIPQPFDIAYADSFLDGPDIVETHRGQTWDLRGSPYIPAYFNANGDIGPFGDTYLADRGPYTIAKQRRTYVV